MSRRRAYSEKTISVMRRFFEIIEEVRSDKRLRNVEEFCEKHKIDKRHLYAQKQDLSKGYFEASWICSIVEEFSVSPVWILTGAGEKYTK